MKNIDIRFLGTGNAFSKKYGNNSAVITVHSNGVKKNILIDCGRTTPDNLYQSGFTWNDIDAIFITHLHGDHIYGLEEAGFYGKYVLNKKMHIILPDRKTKEDLWTKVLKGTMSQGGSNVAMTFEDYFTYEIVDSSYQFFIFNDVMFSVYRTQHVKNKKSFGLIIGEEKYVVYTSDSLFDKDFIKIAIDNGAQAVFHDCQFKNYEGKVHASLDDFLSLSDSERELTHIMHYEDSLYENYVEIKNMGMKIVNKSAIYSFEVE